MRPHSDATRVAFRRAVWASVAIHVVAVGAFFVLLRSSEHKPREAAIDTRAPEVRLSFAEDTLGAEVSSQPAPPTPAAPPNTGAATGATNTNTSPQSPEAVPPLQAGPFAPTPLRTLPAELVAILRKPGANPTPTMLLDPNVKPAGATGAGANAKSAPALHGARKPGQTVVYVLDASGSMGAGGKFDAARAALVATLMQQPATVRFQVIVYDSTARPVLASDGTALAATDANVRAVTTKLAMLEPRGKSNHLVAVRAALGFRPDVIVLLTDADDLTAAAIKPVLATESKPVAVCVGLVTAGGVRSPRELK